MRYDGTGVLQKLRFTSLSGITDCSSHPRFPDHTRTVLLRWPYVEPAYQRMANVEEHLSKLHVTAAWIVLLSGTVMLVQMV